MHPIIIIKSAALPCLILVVDHFSLLSLLIQPGLLGSIYLFNRSVLMKTNSIVGKKCYGLILKGKETINIDTKEQLNYLRVIYKK